MIIGHFNKTDDKRFTGVIRTLTLTTEAVFEPNAEKKGEKSPDFRITAGDADIGGAWLEKSEAGNAYLSVRIDDPALPAPISCALLKSGIEHGYQLVWDRPRRKRAEKLNGEF